MKQLFILLLISTLSYCKAQSFKLSDEAPDVGQIYTDYNIFFSLAMPDLLVDKCKPTLDSILTFLNSHSTYIIEIGIHTDFRGNDQENKALSQSRANNLKEYFVNKGIDVKRLVAVGYGETKPLRSLEAQSKLGDDFSNVNRRATIKILKK